MILEIKRLLSKGEYEGNFSYEKEPFADCLLLPLCKIEGAVSVRGEYEIFSEGEVEVKIVISYLLVGQCGYCLNDAKKRVEYSAEGLFTTEGDGEDDYRYDGNRLDIAPLVRDALLISQPNVLLCDDCGGDKG